MKVERRRAAGMVLASVLVLVSPLAVSQTQKPQAPPAPAPAQMPSEHPLTVTKKPAPPKAEKKVDLNNAPLAELKTLPSVGDVEAKKIIANRPYISKVDLVTKAGLPEGVYLAVRDRVVVNDMRRPAPKK